MLKTNGADQKTKAPGTIQTLEELPTTVAREAAIPLKAEPPFLYFVDPLQVNAECGRRYLPVKIQFFPGGGGVSAQGDPKALLMYQADIGRTQVPIRFRVLAWGQEVDGYVVPMELGRDAVGKPIMHYHDVWTRYKRLGNTVIPEWDKAGFEDFCQRVEVLMDGPPDPSVLDGETARLAQIAAQQFQMARPGSPQFIEAERLQALATSLPEK